MNQAELLARIALLESKLVTVEAVKVELSAKAARMGKGASGKRPAKDSGEKAPLSFESVGFNFIVEEEYQGIDADGNACTKTRNTKTGTRIGDAQSKAMRALRNGKASRAWICSYFVPHTTKPEILPNGEIRANILMGNPQLRSRTEVEGIEAERFAAIETESRIKKGLDKQFSPTAKASAFAANVDESIMVRPLTIPAEVERWTQVVPYNRETETQAKRWMKNPMEYRAWDKSRKAQGLALQKSK